MRSRESGSSWSHAHPWTCSPTVGVWASRTLHTPFVGEWLWMLIHHGCVLGQGCHSQVCDLPSSRLSSWDEPQRSDIPPPSAMPESRHPCRLSSCPLFPFLEKLVSQSITCGHNRCPPTRLIKMDLRFDRARCGGEVEAEATRSQELTCYSMIDVYSVNYVW
jgi:hypothetical protein